MLITRSRKASIKTSVTIRIQPAGGGPPRSLAHVDSSAACIDDAFFVQANDIVLCTSTCTAVQADPTGELELFAACAGDLPGEGEGEGEGEPACEECSCGQQACIDGACGDCTSTDECCPGLVCINGSCLPPSG